MAGEIVGGMDVNLNSGELFFFAVQSKENWSFGADLGSGVFSDEVGVDFLTYHVQFVKLPCSVQNLYP